jgi:hypothetical protein
MTESTDWPAMIRQAQLQLILEGYEPSDQQVLHWLADEDRWEIFNWGRWLRLRSGMFCDQVKLDAGIHHFVVCIHDREGLHNLIPHKYLIDPGSTIGAANFAGLTKEERAEDFQLSIKREFSQQERQRWEQLGEREKRALLPPPESIDALRRALDEQRPLPDSAAEKVLRDLLTN